MSTKTEVLPEILIPSLPNDVALQCLARVPMKYHPVLAAVSKPIRSLLSSPDFFAVRSSLNCNELLFYLRIRDFREQRWFMVYRRRITNCSTATTIFKVPGSPKDPLEWPDYAIVGPKIYDLGNRSSKEVWIFDCRFHTWERGPSMPMGKGFDVKTAVSGGKICVIGYLTEEDSWACVFDTVDGRWEALPGPKLGVYKKPVVGCAIRDGKVCVWLEQEELRFDPAMKTWEVFESSIGLGLRPSMTICAVNGVLYCFDDSCWMIKRFDERIGVWKMLELVNNGGTLLNRLNHFSKPWMVNVGGRLVIMGTENIRCDTQVRCGEIEVKKVGDGDFRGKVLWSDMVFSTANWIFACLPVSL